MVEFWIRPSAVYWPEQTVLSGHRAVSQNLLSCAVVWRFTYANSPTPEFLDNRQIMTRLLIISLIFLITYLYVGFLWVPFSSFLDEKTCWWGQENMETMEWPNANKCYSYTNSGRILQQEKLHLSGGSRSTLPKKENERLCNERRCGWRNVFNVPPSSLPTCIHTNS